MWCKECQQDVPAVVSAASGIYGCPRCGLNLCDDGQTSESIETAAEDEKSLGHLRCDIRPVGAGPRAAPSFDGWELSEQLSHIERRLAAKKPTLATGESAERKQFARIDSQHPRPGGWQYRTIAQPAPKKKPAETSGDSQMAVLTWFVFSLGMMGLTCGGVLMVWSLLVEKADLWRYGLPISLGGLVVLAIGFVLQLDRLWNDNRNMAAKLDHVDERLIDLRTTTLLGSEQETGSAQFYSHMAEGASPQLLLADLKSQLDLLAVKLSEEEWSA